MKITVSKHTTIDWEKVKGELTEQATSAIEDLIGEGVDASKELKPGETKTLSSDVGKIVLRRAKD